MLQPVRIFATQAELRLRRLLPSSIGNFYKLCRGPYLRIFHKFATWYTDHRFDLRFLRRFCADFINQKIIELLSTIDRSNQPTWFCATTCPSVISLVPVFDWSFATCKRVSTNFP